MPNDVSLLKEKISDLEVELAQKSAELIRCRAQISEANNRIEKILGQVAGELEQARRLQRSLSSTEIPAIPGFEFSTKFVFGTKHGGDYFDIFEHEDKMKFGIILLSCSGYAMSSVMISVMLKLSSRIASKQVLAPHQAIQSIVQELKGQLSPKDSASLFYGVIDRRDMILSYCSVGGINGLIQVQGKSAFESLSSNAPVISAKSLDDESLKMETKSISLNAKDRILLVTEGVIEAQSADGQTFGWNSILSCVNSVTRQGVHDLRNEVLYQVEKFSGRSEPVRDQTVIVTEVKDKVIKLARK